MGRVLVVAMIVAGLAATGLPAQEASLAQPGQRVKVRSPDARGVFVVQSAAADTLVLAASNGGTHVVPVASISRFEVSAGERTRLESFGRGAGFGFLIGAVIGGGLGLTSGNDGIFSAGETALILGTFTGGVGAIIGGALGAANPGERWRRVPVRRVTVAPSSGGFAAAVSLAF
jgi:hypothetical protein